MLITFRFLSIFYLRVWRFSSRLLYCVSVQGQTLITENMARVPFCHPHVARMNIYLQRVFLHACKHA